LIFKRKVEDMVTSINDVSGDTSTTTSHPLPSVEGVPKERVAASTVYLFERLFPGQHGIDFLARLLRHAQEKQLVLPDMGPEVTDVAVITVPSLRILARLIHLSYDTTEKYVVTLCHLRLLYKQRRRRQIILHFPLCAPALPEPEALTPLTDYRSKVATFARQVTHRLQQLREHGELPWPSARVPPSAFLMTAPSGVDALFNDICQAVGQEVDAETAQRLVIRIRQVFQYHCQSQHTPSKDDSGGNGIVAQAQKAILPASKGGLLPASLEASPHQSRLLLPKGDSDHLRAGDALATPSQKSPSVNPLPPKGDSDHLRAGDALATPSQKSLSADLPLPKGDFSASALPTQSRPSSPKGGSSLSASAYQKATLPPSSPIQHRHTAPKDDSLVKKGDSEQHSRDILPTNVNVKKILECITTFNVSNASRLCCHIFDEPMTKQGIYAKLFRDIEYDTSAITAALFYTLAHRRDGTIQKPVAMFIQRCKDYHRTGIPDEAKKLVETYGHLSYAQIQETFPVSRASTLPAVSSVPKGAKPSRALSSPSADRLPAAIKPKLARPARQVPGMPLETLKAIIEQIRTNPHTYYMQCAPYRQHDGTGLLLIEDWLGQQRWICSREEWERDAPAIRRSLWPRRTDHGQGKEGEHR
jgi:hypothetical protein